MNADTRGDDGAALTPRDAAAAGWAGRRSRAIVGAYVAAGITWILASDVLLAGLDLGPGRSAAAAAGKGLAFVGATALVLHWRLRAILGDLQATRADLDAVQEQLRRAIVEAPIPGVIHAEDGSILLVNRAWREITGYGEAELRTVPDWTERAYGEPERRAPIEAAIRALYGLGRRVDEGDFAVRVADGSTRTWSFSSSPLGRLSDGRRLVLSMALDVTERRRAEDALRAGERRFRTLVEAAPEAIIIAVDLHFAYANPACVALLGARDAAELLGGPLLERFHPDDREALGAWVRRPGERREPAGPREATLRTLDGREVLVELATTPLSHEGRDGALVFARDLTARRDARRALVQSASRLRELSRRLLDVQETERRRLARELHDEIGQGLTAIKMGIQAARRRPEQFADRLDDAMAILDGMTDQVRNLALDLRPSLLDDFGLVAALRWYVERFRDRGAIAGEFRSNAEEAPIPPEVATACFRAVQEALTNVARHAGAGRFCVELDRGPLGLALRIRDDGVGFDPAAAARRTGMGLDGMRERVEQAGGRVEVRSAPGAGTEIQLGFPPEALVV